MRILITQVTQNGNCQQKISINLNVYFLLPYLGTLFQTIYRDFDEAKPNIITAEEEDYVNRVFRIVTSNGTKIAERVDT